MPVAEIITIGTELLLGEIVDTNSHYIARTLRDAGVDLYRTHTVGDNVERIAEVVREALARAEIVITTGGLGPTVDDPTREAIALAVGRSLEFRPDLWEQIVERFSRYGKMPTENNRRQAYVPQGSLALENPVGTAPSFIVETEDGVVISLPGVPREMEHLLEHAVLPYLRERYDLRGVIRARVLHTAGVGESQIDEIIADLEQMSNPTVGLAAHPAQVDVRITAKADSLEAAEAMIAAVEAQLRERLGDWVYGADEDTLEGVVLDALAVRGWRLTAVEGGLGGALLQRLADHPAFLGGEVVAPAADADALRLHTHALKGQRGAECALGALLVPGEMQQTVHLVLITPDQEIRKTRTYGGAPRNAPRWAVALALNYLRRLLAV